MRRLLTALGLGAAMSGAAQAQDGYYGKYETPRYSVEQMVGDAEVRLYAPHVLAVVSVQGDQRGALNRGFRTLAGYIFGGNEGSTSVAMTSPVTQTGTMIEMTSPVGQSGEDGLWDVTFMMPRDYTLDTLPVPDNAAVRFDAVPERRMIVLTFSGRAPDSVLKTRTDELTQIARAAQLRTTGDAIFMYYDDPFTLPFARRNEVAFLLGD